MKRRGRQSGPRLWCTILSATGVHYCLIPLFIGLLATIIWHPGRIETFGPLTLVSPLPVVVAVPFLTSIASAISHVPSRTAVIVRSLRTFCARLLSHGTILAGSALIMLLGDALTEMDVAAAGLRNLFLLASLGLFVSALAGPVFAWVPVLIAFGVGILSPDSENSWSLNSMLMTSSAEPTQLIAAGTACLLALTLAALDPLNKAYLPARRTHRDRSADTSVEEFHPMID